MVPPVRNAHIDDYLQMYSLRRSTDRRLPMFLSTYIFGNRLINTSECSYQPSCALDVRDGK
jgi:hypothetical protein